ncbi:hypothetical protein HPP92_016896 [Vanilla planifolia]|uniref:At2g24240-like C-terminal beta-propeller domain-containing protein n=1 Tax=Vanilla planifolia TaxID=51239 RepID=A0A835QN79_VANPL|nr:hypothetical protein HPP92_017487 [Vanilla planifolia]KAG0472350.1 hypothetical protein HPP92_016896 [Vanilla planifolia]
MLNRKSSRAAKVDAMSMGLEFGIRSQETNRISFYQPPGCSFGDADKLQWIDGNSCLMVATLFPRTDNCSIGLLDFRERIWWWSWSDEGTLMGAASLTRRGFFMPLSWKTAIRYVLSTSMRIWVSWI